MGEIINEPYRPVFWLKNAHINTIYPHYFRKQNRPDYFRDYYTTDDGDFIEVDKILKGSKKVLLLLHGLEGSSDSQYIIGIVDALKDSPLDIWAMNHRSCSGKMNHSTTLYHSGFVEDVRMLLNELRPKYDEIIIVGYSLGGNMALKYMGTEENHDKIGQVFAVSVPLDLKESSKKLSTLGNRMYVIKFLETLIPKMKEKAIQHPDLFTSKELNSIKSMTDFDNIVTSRLFGFKDAQDYYNKANSLQNLSDIKIPTTIIAAEDDPFLAEAAYPIKEVKSNKNLSLVLTKYGGHVGFCYHNRKKYWLEDYLKSRIEQYI
ncbi:MAG TPA: alpha/beta fold hydrolase [Saprospiraceae bacterium]|nr:alpha/beta fold hydrolase [Saprospiraceae bacterium]MCB9327793.1 alpha/beta fold hydrolase [Lewinellaceae bacterium]HPK10117.1 alpha/beta fold hydrolase [Saprospiraceae bacterium]HRX27869.1 alpha/beta fold hydrolase [Saprospiraceae bacterium]